MAVTTSTTLFQPLPVVKFRRSPVSRETPEQRAWRTRAFRARINTSVAQARERARTLMDPVIPELGENLAAPIRIYPGVEGRAVAGSAMDAYCESHRLQQLEMAS